MDIILGALLIMGLRIADVTFGTFRTLMVVQGKRAHAGVLGFCEVLIWIFAMRYIVQHLDQTINLFAYATGFALGNVLGITIEQKFAIGYVQLNIISRNHIQEIATELRTAHFAATNIPAEGNEGKRSVIVTIIRRKDQKAVMRLIESIDPNVFVTVQHSRPYRGYIHGSRK